MGHCDCDCKSHCGKRANSLLTHYTGKRGYPGSTTFWLVLMIAISGSQILAWLWDIKVIPLWLDGVHVKRWSYHMMKKLQKNDSAWVEESRSWNKSEFYRVINVHVRRPYWILKNITTFQKSVSTKVVPTDPRNSNPVSFALPLRMYTNI